MTQITGDMISIPEAYPERHHVVVLATLLLQRASVPGASGQLASRRMTRNMLRYAATGRFRGWPETATG